MNKHVFRCACLVAAALMCAPVMKADAPIRNDTLIPFYRDVRAAVCDPTDNAVGMITAATPLSAPLFDGNRGPTGMAPAPCNMVLAPDGHQITLGEFNAAIGRILVKCINTGTHAAIHYSGLVPKGTYSVWLFKVNPSPPPPYIGAGTLGITALSENHFVASEAGEGEISRTTPEEDLSAFGHVGSCFLDGVVELHLVYHIDQQTHGFLPGPINTWVVNARFFFP
jgi:hypothetical protein